MTACDSELGKRLSGKGGLLGLLVMTYFLIMDCNILPKTDYNILPKKELHGIWAQGLLLGGCQGLWMQALPLVWGFRV